ncbi:MAG: response regulator [Deltaproteobacteria bacterium]|nr:response regulator [Deltaproteobacteria bacterium]
MSRLFDLEARIAALADDFAAGLPARREALAAARASLAQGDASARASVAAEAHKLRGTARTFGHPELTSLAAEIEDGAATSSSSTLLDALDALLRAMDDVVASRPSAGEPAPAPVVTPRPEIESEPVAKPPARRTLVLDDDEGTRRLLSVCLRPATGFQTVAVATWAQAFEHLAAEPFDLVVTDWMMPDGDGLSFLRTLRASSVRNAQVPVVVLSAAAPRQPAAGEPGPVAWIQKPFVPRALVERLLAIVSG